MENAESHIPITTVPSVKHLPLRAIELRAILKRLVIFNGNRTRTAASLHISLRCLRNKIAELKGMGVNVPESLRYTKRTEPN